MDQRAVDQVHAFLRDQASDADDQRDRRVDVEPEAALDKLLADPFPCFFVELVFEWWRGRRECAFVDRRDGGSER